MNFKLLLFFHSALFLISMAFNSGPWYFLMLTAAQLLFVPLVLLIVTNKENFIYRHYFFIAAPALLAVCLLQITGSTEWDGVLAFLYLFYTLLVAWTGLQRFLHRGFSDLEEFSLDAAMFFLAIGGAWFFAYEAGLETGFSPIITWLTGIHFHYSAFLLPVFVGFLGRSTKTRLYKIVCTLIIINPIVLAFGITFSRWLEFFSVLLYIFAIYSLIYLTFKTSFSSSWQKWLVRSSFGSLGITILFSLLYAYGNAFGANSVNIGFMLQFHGFFNAVGFALCGFIGWAVHPPAPKAIKKGFPVSKIRGRQTVGHQLVEDYTDPTKTYSCLVDDMAAYGPAINLKTLPFVIRDFYENTGHYRLFAKVQWHAWFKPFAGVYRLMSRHMQQLNLPLSSNQIEMTGSITALDQAADGRTHPRAWLRKIDGEVVFVALYSIHQTKDQAYMNVALPLPGSSMIGILALEQQGEKLLLTSCGDAASDAGIYLAVSKYLFKLPLRERFLLEETHSGCLRAIHKMKIFSLPFLTIDYVIEPKDGWK